MKKRTRSKIPDGVTTVRNVVTGETKSIKQRVENIEMEKTIEIYSDDTALMGPTAPPRPSQIDGLIKLLATISHRFGNTRVRFSLSWGGSAMRDVFSFQAQVKPWMDKCFGSEISDDAVERNHRFLEESLELIQACGCSVSEAHQLVDYVFNRPTGEKPQEVGGVMVTLAALCLAQELDMHVCGDAELERIWTKVDQIRSKQVAKPKHSPLPA